MINVRSGKPYDVYIGRRHKDIVGSDWKWGNPFAIGRDGDRAEVIDKFEQWIMEPEQAELLQEARRTLAGKVLGCWCSPLACHGDVLARLANSGGEESKGQKQQAVANDGYHIIQEGPTNFFHRLEVAAESLPFLVGKSGSNLKAIMHDTSTTITVKDTENAIEIRGTSRENVAEARTRLDISVVLAEDKLPYTHFISVPLQNTQTQAKLGEFAEQAIALKVRGMDRSILSPPKKLHLTCFVLRLQSPAQLAAAKDILQQLTPELQAVAAGPLKLNLKGLAVMGDDAKEANVVYAKVAENEGLAKLKRLCKALIARLQQADLLSPAEISHQNLLDEAGEVSIKFHATVINTKHRQPAQPQRVAVDASPLLEALGGLDLGEFAVPALQLSCMQGRSSEGYYPSALELPLTPQ